MKLYYPMLFCGQCNAQCFVQYKSRDGTRRNFTTDACRKCTSVFDEVEIMVARGCQARVLTKENK